MMEIKEKASQRDIITSKIRLDLMQKSDEEIIELILSSDKEDMNNRIKGGSFPAWDIAYRLKTHGWQASHKQKKAFINILTYVLVDEVFDRLINQ